MLRPVSGLCARLFGFLGCHLLIVEARKTLEGGKRGKGASKRCRKCSSGWGVRLAMGLLCKGAARAETMLSCLLGADVVAAVRKGPGVLMT